MRAGWLTIFAALSLVASGSEDGRMSAERRSPIRQVLQKRIDAGELAGAVALVAHRGRAVYFEAQGMADIGSSRPMAKDTLFNIASMSKPITAVAVLMLVEEGKIGLNDAVSLHLPAFRGVNVGMERPAVGAGPKFDTVPASRDITVRDLLTHTSGIVSGPMGRSVVPYRKANETLSAYALRLAASPLEFQPGSRWAYSPAGYEILACLLETVSGVAFDEFLQRRVLEPLAMRDTFLGVPGAKTSRQATIYRYLEGRLMVWENATAGGPSISGAGGHTTTAADYMAFLQMLLNGGQWKGKRLLSRRSVETMLSPQAPDTLPGRRGGEAWGLGVTVLTNARAVGSPLSDGSASHGGNFGTFFWIDPKEKVVAILLTQTSMRAPSLLGDFQAAAMQAFTGRK